MILAKEILKALNDKGRLNKFAIYLETDNNKTPERLAFLSDKGYIKITPKNEYFLTSRGKELLKKI